jgi:hypothetical protein
VRGGPACTLVLVYVSIRLRETVSEFRSIEIQHNRPVTTQPSVLGRIQLSKLGSIFESVLESVLGSVLQHCNYITVPVD